MLVLSAAASVVCACADACSAAAGVARLAVRVVAPCAAATSAMPVLRAAVTVLVAWAAAAAAMAVLSAAATVAWPAAAACSAIAVLRAALAVLADWAAADSAMLVVSAALSVAWACRVAASTAPPAAAVAVGSRSHTSLPLCTAVLHRCTGKASTPTAALALVVLPLLSVTTQRYWRPCVAWPAAALV